MVLTSNMREIKFRAWDKRTNKFDERFPRELKDFGELGWTLTSNDFEFQQYTGLKDKNDKEIYEGDIVKGGWNDDVYPVEFTFRWIHQYVEYGMEPLEVIGNVYENPELLDKE